jgi:hypothetical protein
VTTGCFRMGDDPTPLFVLRGAAALPHHRGWDRLAWLLPLVFPWYDGRLFFMRHVGHCSIENFPVSLLISLSTARFSLP